MDSNTDLLNLPTICDGEIKLFLITDEYYDKTIEIILNRFILSENVCIATDLAKSAEAKEEFEQWAREVLKDHVSIGAKHIPTNRLVAVCVNKVLFPNDEVSLKMWSKFKTPNKRSIITYLNKLEKTFDLHKNWQIDCSFELLFLTTIVEFERRGIGRELVRFSIDLATNLGSGFHRDILPDELKDKRPKAVCSVFTSLFSQKIGKALGFETIFEIPYSEFEYNGRSYVEKIDPLHKVSVFAAKRLF